jgi:uncharacterized protein (DUF433 family)
MATKSGPVDHRQYIESRPDVMLGKPVIKGTRLTVELILKRLSEGAALADLQEAYPGLAEESVNAALAYASDVPLDPLRLL